MYFRPYLVLKVIFVLFLYFSNVNSEISEIESNVLCSKNNVYSCICNYYTSDASDLPVIDIVCSAVNILSLSKQIVIPELTNSLDLSLNDITAVTGDDTLTSANLQILYLNKNRINKIDKDAFNFLPNLTNLDLSNNLITKLEPNTFNNIKKLKFLNLAYNQIKDFEVHIFKPVQHLKELNLNGNNLGFFFNNTKDLFDTNTFCLNPGLAILKIENNNITDLPDTFFKSAHNLKKISLARNNFVFLPELPSTLGYLDISSTQISIISPEDFSNYPVIDKLILNNLQNLSRIEKYAFKDLKNLEVLKIENCKNFKRFSPDIFGITEDGGYEDYNYSLRQISLMGSGIITLDNSWYPIFSRLSHLDLRGNPWRCDCKISWLQQLHVPEKHKEFIRCYKPQRLHGHLLWSLKNTQLVCVENPDILHWIITHSLILLCVIMICLAIWLVLIWPNSKKTKRIVHPAEQPYTIISLEPNNAENI